MSTVITLYDDEDETDSNKKGKAADAVESDDEIILTSSTIVSPRIDPNVIVID